MKRFFTFLLITFLILSSASCFASGVDVKSLSDAQLTALQSEVAQEIAFRNPQGESSGDIGNYYVSIKDARLAKDRDGKDCIVITCDWSHSEDDAQSFMWSLSCDAFQDGIELDTTLDSTISNSIDTLDTKLKAGATFEVEIAYVLRNTTSPVEIEISEMLNWDDTGMITKAFTLSD